MKERLNVTKSIGGDVYVPIATTRKSAVAEPPKCLGPPAPAIVLRTSDGDAGSPPTLEVR